MEKKAYIQPVLKENHIGMRKIFLQSLSAPGEGIGSGGEGDPNDDPDAKIRDDEWGSLW